MEQQCKAKTKEGKPCLEVYGICSDGKCSWHSNDPEAVEWRRKRKSPISNEKMKPVSIIEAIESPKLFGPLFKDWSTWSAWLTFFKAYFGLGMNEEDLKLYKECTKRDIVKEEGYQEAYAIVGTDGGKSYASALIATFVALFGDFQEHLARGQKAFVFCIAVDKEQAAIVFNYIRGILELFPEMVEKELAWEIELKNKITISVKTCSFRSTRGFRTCCIILDELAFYRSEESANPAEELLVSLLPRLLPGGKLVGISTPYGRFGFLYQTYKDHFAKDDSDVLVWQAANFVMNPNVKVSIFEKLFKRDKARMRAEVYAEFREDLEGYLTEEEIAAVTNEGVEVYPPEAGIRYVAFVDPSGGKGDSYTMAIAHPGSGIAVLDWIGEVRPPFDPKFVAQEFSQVLKSYGIHRVIGDRFAPGFVSSTWKENGIEYMTAGLTKSDIFLDFGALVRMQRVELLDNERLAVQLQSLERKAKSAGRDLIDHPPGLHDDLANSVAGVCVAVNQTLAKIATPEQMAMRLPQMGEREYPQTFKSEVKDMERTFQKEAGGEKILKPGDRGYVPKPGDLGYIDRAPRKKEKRELFPEIDSKTYRRGNRNNKE